MGDDDGLTDDDAVRLAHLWMESLQPAATPRLVEHDLGWVITPVSPDGARRPGGEGLAFVDRHTGIVHVRPSATREDDVAAYAGVLLGAPPAAEAWTPNRRARRYPLRTLFPCTVTALDTGDGFVNAYSAKGDGDLVHHSVVAGFLADLPLAYRDRVGARSSAAVALSNALLAEDDRRRRAGRPEMSVAEARNAYLAGFITTSRRRERGDPTDRRFCPPSPATVLLLRYLGLDRAAPPSAAVAADRRPAGGEVPEVETVLRESGWVPGRDVSGWVRAAVGALAHHGFAPFAAATAALAEFGGLYVIQDHPGVQVRRRPFVLLPGLARHCPLAVKHFGSVLGALVFPVGVEGDTDAFLVVDEHGRVFSLDEAGEWFLGADMSAALRTLITGVLPPRVDDEGRW